jgi:CRP-like cAMP-binding protein
MHSSRCSRISRCSAGWSRSASPSSRAPLIRAGQPGHAGIIIVAGEAVVAADAAAGIGEIEVKAGSLIGETAMLIEHDYRITVTARTSVRALRLTRAAMHELMREDPLLADHFVARLASRLSRVAIELRQIDETLALAAETARAAATAVPA